MSRFEAAVSDHGLGVGWAMIGLGGVGAFLSQYGGTILFVATTAGGFAVQLASYALKRRVAEAQIASLKRCPRCERFDVREAGGE